MKVILFGATGMVGQGVLRECLLDSDVKKILSVSRTPVKQQHQKFEQVLLKDLSDLSSIRNNLANFDACFFCIGVSSVGMNEEQYKKITYDLTMSIANTLVQANRNMTFVFVSGSGTDSSEKGRSMWARIKGKAENGVLNLPFKKHYMFRPGYIQPMNGEISKVGWYNYFYFVSKPLYFLIRTVVPKLATSTVNIGKAMIYVAKKGTNKTILENSDINKLVNEHVANS